MALKKLLALVVPLGVVEVSIAKPYVNSVRNQNGQRNLQMHVDLYLDYYCLRCPQVESIGRSVTFQYVSRRPILAVALLMMHFQDYCLSRLMISVLVIHEDS